MAKIYTPYIKEQRECTTKPLVNYFTSVKKDNQLKLDVLVACIHKVDT